MPSALYEGRDLKPMIDLDVLIAEALAQQFALDYLRVAATLFPASRPARPLEGLIRA